MQKASYSMTDEQIHLVVNMSAWSESAACQGHPDFLPVNEAGTPKEELSVGDMHKMKRVCASCPVKLDCLQHAMTYPERGGVWGGMGPKERTRYRDHLRRSTL